MSHLPLARVIAHRGASGDAPENTISALKLAIAQGATCVEIDVSISADQVPYVHHDHKLERCTSGSGLLCEHSASDLDGLTAGGHWQGFDNEPLPRLEAIVRLLTKHHTGLNLEIKPYKGLEIQTVEAICTILNDTWPAELPIIISSFNHDCLAMSRQRSPEIARAPLLGAIPDNWHALMQQYDAQNLHCDQKSLDPGLAREVIDAGYGLYCYTVNDSERAQTLFSHGVHGVFTDYPRQLRSAFPEI